MCKLRSNGNRLNSMQHEIYLQLYPILVGLCMYPFCKLGLHI